MDIRAHILQLRHDLANNLGVELTPAETDEIVKRAGSLFEVVDIDMYRYFRDMGPGACLMEAKRQGIKSLAEFFSIRDILLFVGERKYPDEPKRTDKPYLWK